MLFVTAHCSFHSLHTPLLFGFSQSLHISYRTFNYVSHCSHSTTKLSYITPPPAPCPRLSSPSLSVMYCVNLPCTCRYHPSLYLHHHLSNQYPTLIVTSIRIAIYPLRRLTQTHNPFSSLYHTIHISYLYHNYIYQQYPPSVIVRFHAKFPQTSFLTKSSSSQCTCHMPLSTTISTFNLSPIVSLSFLFATLSCIVHVDTHLTHTHTRHTE